MHRLTKNLAYLYFACIIGGALSGCSMSIDIGDLLGFQNAPDPRTLSDERLDLEIQNLLRSRDGLRQQLASVKARPLSYRPRYSRGFTQSEYYKQFKEDDEDERDRRRDRICDLEDEISDINSTLKWYRKERDRRLDLRYEQQQATQAP